MRVLLVAPSTDLLLVDAEVQDVLTSGLDVTPMLGDVSRIDLTRTLRGSDFDVLWFATHGDKTGILLSDGVLSASTLTQLVRGKIATVFMNTCDSYDTAQMLQNETGATIICTVKEVPDQEAYHTASRFAEALAETGDEREAYDQSKPGNNRAYLFLAGNSKKKMTTPDKKSQRDIDDLFDALLGNRMAGRIGLLEDVANIKRDVGDIKGNMAVMDSRLTHRIEGVEAGMTGMHTEMTGMQTKIGVVQATIEKIQISVDSRNDKRDELDERVVISQTRLLIYIALGAAAGVGLSLLVLKFFGGVEKIDPSLGFVLPTLFSGLYDYGRNCAWHLALPPKAAFAAASHAGLVLLWRVALLTSPFLG